MTLRPQVVGRIDLNADVGEATDSVEVGIEHELLAWVTSANVTCGGHAGDDGTMRTTLRRAQERGVAVGAHPSFPDRAGFGRVELPLSPAEIETSVAAQIAALGRIARDLGLELDHVKPHGALYHAASRRPEVAEAVARAAARWRRDLVLVGQAGAPSLATWRALGFRVAGEAFADRAYARDGALVARSRPGALLTNTADVVAQALALARGEGVTAAGGVHIPVVADTLCLHADTPGAPGLARAVHEALAADGMRLQSLRDLA